MTMWEFALTFEDGVVIGQTAIAEGATEADAVASALVEVSQHAGLILVRPGVIVLPEVEARWREIYGDESFPQIVQTVGRLALYARGGSKPSGTQINNKRTS